VTAFRASQFAAATAAVDPAEQLSSIRPVANKQDNDGRARMLEAAGDMYRILSVQLCRRAARHEQLSAVHRSTAGHLDSKASGDKLEEADSC